MARTYGQRPGAAAFAAAWAQLSPAAQQRMVRQFRSALHAVKDEGTGAVQPLHPPMVTQHAHLHYDRNGGQHNHAHQHGADGTPDADHGHDHQDADGAAARSGGRSAKHVRFQRGQLTVVNRAQSARTAAAWERLARTSAEIERRGG